MMIPRSFIFGLIFLCVCACNEREPMEIMEDYEMGFVDDGQVRTYSYFQNPELDTLMVRFTPSMENGIRYVTEASYTNKIEKTTRRFRMDGNRKEMVQQYMYYYPNPLLTDKFDILESEIIEHKIIKGAKYNGGNYRFTVEAKTHFVTDATVLEIFEKDTVFEWKGNILPTLKFKDVVEYNTFYRYLPFISNSKINAEGYVLFAKGVGLIYYESRAENSLSVLTLIDLNVSKLKTE